MEQEKIKHQICICCLVIVFILGLLCIGGCNLTKEDIHVHEEQGREAVGNIVIISECGDGSYIGYDKTSGYEYFLSRTYYGSMVIGGNVLTVDGLPKKFEGYQK